MLVFAGEVSLKFLKQNLSIISIHNEPLFQIDIQDSILENMRTRGMRAPQRVEVSSGISSCTFVVEEESGHLTVHLDKA